MDPGSSQRHTVMGTQWHQSHTTMRKTPAQYRDKNVTSRGMQHGDTLLKEGGVSILGSIQSLAGQSPKQPAITLKVSLQVVGC